MSHRRMQLSGNAVEYLENRFPGFQDWLGAKRTPTHGELGILGGASDLEFIEQMVWGEEVTPDDRIPILERGLERECANGLTAYSSNVQPPPQIEALHEMERQDRVPTRVSLLPGPEAAVPATNQIMSGWYTSLPIMPDPDSIGVNDRLWVGGRMSSGWDGPWPGECRSAYFGEDSPLGPLPQELEESELCATPEAQAWYLGKEGIKAGWRPTQYHGNGPDAIRRTALMLEQAIEEAPDVDVETVRDLRTTADHTTGLGPIDELPYSGNPSEPSEGLESVDWDSDVTIGEKARELGIVFSLQPNRLGLASQGHEEVLGSEFVDWVSPANSLIENDHMVVGGERTFGKVGQFVNQYVFIERFFQGRVWAPDEQVGRVQALKMNTNWGALYLRKEDDIGSLEKGKFADFIVLDRNYFEINVEDIPYIRNLMTVVGGEIEHLEESLANELDMDPVGFQKPEEWPEMEDTEMADYVPE